MAATVRTRAEAEAALRALPGGARVLDAVAATPGAWVVGGAVRDALLGRVPEEVDVVLVEGRGVADGQAGRDSGVFEAADAGRDARVWSRGAEIGTADRALNAFATALGSRLAEHHVRFGTGTAWTPEGLRVDFARSRRERYPHPGALPEVLFADAGADLSRRDVTVNAIALRPGEPLRAVEGALADLAAGVLRVLHPRSFEDDATRLWRLARYGARLAFTVEPGTARLAAAADPASVSGARHGNELRRTLAEADAVRALAATRALAPQLFPAGFSPRPAGDALALLPPGEGRAGLIVLARAVAAVDAATLVAWLDALAFPVPERDVVAAGSRAAILHPLRAATRASSVARAARGAPLELVALAGGPNAKRWIDDLRHVRLAITGVDLLAAGVPGGPGLGARLQRALDARLDGAAETREEQLRVALS